MEWPDLSDLVLRVKSGELRPSQLLKDAQAEVKKTESFHTLLSINENAEAQAAAADKRLDKGDTEGALFGVPFIAKDNFLTFGGDTTAASKILSGFKAPYQATAVEKLEAAGAILLGKANLDEFAHGSSTENSAFGPTKNPRDERKVPGGSSGGSAAAVALGQAGFALGTDTGGSIRLPASFCGVVGYKPTYGLVSRYGVIAMASSTDVIGPLTRSVADAALVLDVMAGRDPRDATTIERELQSYASLEGSAKTKVGVIKQYMTGDIDPAAKAAVQATIDQLSRAGAEIAELDLPSLDLALACYYIIVPAEISSNLARYDGIRYGYSSQGAANLEDVYELSRAEGFGAEAKRRIMIGAYVLSSGYYDAYYKKAQAVRTLLIEDFARAFGQVDFLIGPTAPSTAFDLGAASHDPLKMYLTDIMTVAVNLAGVPAISLPVGQADGLPIGLQIIAPQRKDRELLGFAQHVEELAGAQNA